MQIDIGYRPAHSMARVQLQHGEAILAESGAMVGMSTNVQMQTGMQNKGGGLLGGLLGGLKRALAGESWFRNTFTAQNGPGEVLLAHALCGDMQVLDMTPQGYYLTSGSFIASKSGISACVSSSRVPRIAPCRTCMTMPAPAKRRSASRPVIGGQPVA